MVGNKLSDAERKAATEADGFDTTSRSRTKKL
jgi:hypothetical protein